MAAAAGRAGDLAGGALNARRGGLVRAADLRSAPVTTLLDAESFDGWLARFDDVPVEQTARFAAARWPNRRRDHVVIGDPADPHAAASVIVVPFAPLASGVAAVKWGPVWRRTGRTADWAAYRAGLSALVASYAVGQGLTLSAMPPADPERGDAMQAALADLGFRPGAQEAHPGRYFVDLTAPLAEIRARFSAKWRYNLKKSALAGFVLRRIEGDAAVKAFGRLHRAMIARKRFHDDSAIDTLPMLLSHPVPALRPAVFIVDRAGEPVAGAVVAHHGDTAHYLFGASDDRGLDGKPGYILQWEIIAWLKARAAARWYALGGTDGDAGLLQFKKGMVGQAGLIAAEPPAWHFAAGARAAAAGRLLHGLRDLKGSLVAWRRVRSRIGGRA